MTTNAHPALPPTDPHDVDEQTLAPGVLEPVSSEAVAVEPRSLGQRVVSAVGWSAGVKIGFQLVTWGMTLAVIRVLAPGDYGLMALTMVFTNVLAAFSNLGLGDALVQRAETPKPLVASVFGVLLLIAAGLTVALSLAAYPIAAWYDDPRLVLLLQVASLDFLLNGLTTIPRMHLTKSLRVRPMFLLEMAGGIVSAVAVVTLAYTGHGVWSLLLGGMLGGGVKAAGFLVITREYWVWPSLEFALVRPLLSYGAFRTLEVLAWIAFTSADVLIIGRLLGPADLGLYSVALNFAGMPLNKIAPIINSVAFPAFAIAQGNPREVRFYALKATRLMSLIAVPVFFGISAVAPEIVDLVFGPRWAAAEPMLAVLALAMTFRAILLVLPNFLIGIGDARAGFWCTLSGAVLFPPAFAIGCTWGIEGVCYAWLIGYPVIFVINALIAARYGGLSVGTLLAIPVRPFIAGAVMIAAVAIARQYVIGPEWVHAGMLVATGAVTYGAVLLLAFRPMADEIVSLVRVARSR